MFASDIHGDYDCACATLEKYRCENAEKLVLLGDILYHGPRNDLPAGYAPKKVIELLREHPTSAEFNLIRSEKTLFEILPKNTDKGAIIAPLAEMLGIDINRTIAIGDYNNDIPMLRAAKLGIAVKNACPDAKDAADLITVSNDEHAIAQVIHGIENGSIKI